MISQSTSGRQQIAQTCELLVIFGSILLVNGSTDFEKVYCFVNNGLNVSSAFCKSSDIFASWPRKCGPKDVLWSKRYVDGWFRFSGNLLKLATHKFAVWYSRSLYIVTRNDVIGSFRSATVVIEDEYKYLIKAAATKGWNAATNEQTNKIENLNSTITQ